MVIVIGNSLKLPGRPAAVCQRLRVPHSRDLHTTHRMTMDPLCYSPDTMFLENSEVTADSRTFKVEDTVIHWYIYSQDSQGCQMKCLGTSFFKLKKHVIILGGRDRTGQRGRFWNSVPEERTSNCLTTQCLNYCPFVKQMTVSRGEAMRRRTRWIKSYGALAKAPGDC